jgi:hypothetical protein
MMLTPDRPDEDEFYRRCRIGERRVREVGVRLFGRLSWEHCLAKALGMRSVSSLSPWFGFRLPQDYQRRLAEAVRRTRDDELAEAMARHEALTLLAAEIEANPLPEPVPPPGIRAADVPAGGEVRAV